ncbi:hypothetical protein [Zavarzinia sp.]
MTLCPIALAVTCKRCPAFAVCPAKSILGDQKRPAPETKEPPKA